MTQQQTMLDPQERSARGAAVQAEVTGAAGLRVLGALHPAG